MKTKIKPTAARKIAFPAAVFCLQKLKGDNFLTECLPWEAFVNIVVRVQLLSTSNSGKFRVSKYTDPFEFALLTVDDANEHVQVAVV